MPPYVINRDSASKCVHDLAHETPQCFIRLRLITPEHREDVAFLDRLPQGYKACHWCMQGFRSL